MFNIIAEKIVAGITAIATLIGGGFGLIPSSRVAELETKVQQLELQIEDFQNISLGSYYSVGSKYYKLFGSGLTSTAVSIVLTSFKSPVNDQELAMANFGEIGYGTIEPENTSNMEFISFSGITQDSSSEKATLTGVVRGINFVYPYNASTTLGKSHSGGSRFIISNPPVHYGEFAAKRNAETIQGDWTFSATSTPQYGSVPTFTSGSQEFATVDYAEDLANLGAAVSSTSTKGVVTIGTSEQRINFTTSTYDGGQLVLRLWDFATSTDKHGATTTPVMTDVDGKLDQSFLDKTEALTWTGDTKFSSTTLSATTTIGDANTDYARFNASTTFEYLTTFNATSTFKNSTTTFDRPPLVADNSEATTTNPYSLATQNYVNKETWTFTSVWGDSFSSTTNDWADWSIATSTGSVGGIKAVEIVLWGDVGAVGARANGSSLQRKVFVASTPHTFTVEVDTNQLIEIFTDSSGNDQWKVTGYWK